MNTKLQVECGDNYSAAHAGTWADMKQHIFEHARLGAVPGKLFLRQPLALTGMEVSLGSIPPGKGMPFLHRHRENEELYIFVSGEGQMVVDGKVFPVREGTVVRVAPAGARSWRNTADKDLCYIVVQAKAGSHADQGGTVTDGEPAPGKPNW